VLHGVVNPRRIDGMQALTGSGHSGFTCWLSQPGMARRIAGGMPVVPGDIVSVWVVGWANGTTFGWQTVPRGGTRVVSR
jgi:hypothetical protein